MPSVVKPLGNAFNIGTGGAAGDIGLATLVSVTNMDTTNPQQVVNQISSFNVYISPGATIYLEKDPTDTLVAPDTATVYATAIAYRT